MLSREEKLQIKQYIEKNGLPLILSVVCDNGPHDDGPWRKVGTGETYVIDFSDCDAVNEVWIGCSLHKEQGLIKLTEKKIREILG